MSFGFKRAKYLGQTAGGPSRSDGDGSGNIMDGDWDELVIRFDRRSRQFKVRTAKEPRNRETAKLKRRKNAKSE